MKTGIYEIRCTANGSRYIGSSIDVEKRWKAHKGHLRRGTHHSPHLQNAWNKYGEDNFVFRPLFPCSRDDLIRREQQAIDIAKPEYNIQKIAGSALGQKLSQETRAKIAARAMGNQRTLGLKHSPETIQKMRQAKLGKPSPTKGRKRDPKAVAATAAAHRGRKRSEETRRRISEARIRYLQRKNGTTE